MSNINIYQYGNTITFECTFTDMDGKRVNPDEVKFTIYDSKYKRVPYTEKVLENTGSLGEYITYYETPLKAQKFYYEFNGLIGGMPFLKRNAFITKFA